MDLHRYPGLVDRLAAEYALGVLRAGSRRRFEQIARSDAAIRVSIESWRARLQSMAELGAATTPPPEVWLAIEQRLDLGDARRGAQVATDRPAARRAPPVSRWFDNLSFWRGWSIAATAIAVLALAIAIGHFAPFASAPQQQVAQQGAQQEPQLDSQVDYVATLADKDAHALVLVTWNKQTSEMTVRRLSGASDPSDKSVQLWGLPKQGHPVSLGVLPRGATARMKVASVNDFPVLAASIEPIGGSPNPNAPSGPVIYTGKVIPTA